MDSLKAVREASTLSRAICTSSGIFFETTLSSTVDIAALHSLRISDLFAYSGIVIRVRCCSIMSQSLNSDGTDATAATSLTRASLSHTERLARCSRASTVGNDMSAVAVASLRRQRSSFTSQLQKQWKSEDAVLLFESNLGDFLQGMEVLKDLFESTASLRASMEKLHRQPVTMVDVFSEEMLNCAISDDDYDMPAAVSIFIGAACLIAQAISGSSHTIESFVSDCLRSSHRDFSVRPDSVFVSRIMDAVAEAVSHVGMDGVLLREMFNHFAVINVSDHHSSSSNTTNPEHEVLKDRAALHKEFLLSTCLSRALLDALTACLHESVVGCFDSPDMLTARGNDEDTHNNDDCSDVSVLKDIKQQTVSNISSRQGNQLSMSPEVRNILEQLAALRNKKSAMVDTTPFSMDSNDCSDPQRGYYSYPAETDAVAENTGEHEQGTADDWVRCYDDNSGNYYFYSESLGVSRWEVG